MSGEWCPGGDKPLHQTTFEKDRPRRVRCGVCNRLLTIRWTNCHDLIPGAEPCWHPSVPRHKVQVKKVRQPSRRQKKQPRGRG